MIAKLLKLELCTDNIQWHCTYLGHMSRINAAYSSSVLDDSRHVTANLFAYLVLQSGEHNVTRRLSKLTRDKYNRHNHLSSDITSVRHKRHSTPEICIHRIWQWIQKYEKSIVHDSFIFHHTFASHRHFTSNDITISGIITYKFSICIINKNFQHMQSHQSRSCWS